MKHASGFTIIEWLIYFFLITTVLTGIFHFVATTQQKLLHLSKKSSAVAQLCGALDALVHDLATAPTDLQKWTLLGPGQISWKKSDGTIGWNLNKKNLYRSYQQFDKNKQAWGKKKKNIVARGVESIQFIPSYEKFFAGNKQLVQTITCKLRYVVEGRISTVERTVLLRNRVVT